MKGRLCEQTVLLVAAGYTATNEVCPQGPLSLVAVKIFIKTQAGLDRFLGTLGPPGGSVSSRQARANPRLRNTLANTGIIVDKAARGPLVP